jgi:N-acetylmuramoyl-L-alanine amidase
MMPKDYEVKQGDCIASIACEQGFSPDTLWSHPENAQLRRLRKDHNILLPGDIVHIPDKQLKEVSAATGARHRFQRTGLAEMLRIILQDEQGQPRADVSYILTIDGYNHDGITGTDGLIEYPIPADAREASLRIQEGERQRVYLLPIGQLDPIDETSGVQMRLRNLDFYGGEVDGALNNETQAAIEEFQRHYGLDPTADLNVATRDKIREVHKS